MLRTLRGIVREGKVSFLESAAVPDGTRALIVLLTDGEEGAAESADFWQAAGQASLDAVWNNTEDDVYAELLEE